MSDAGQCGKCLLVGRFCDGGRIVGIGLHVIVTVDLRSIRDAVVDMVCVHRGGVAR